MISHNHHYVKYTLVESCWVHQNLIVNKLTLNGIETCFNPVANFFLI